MADREKPEGEETRIRRLRRIVIGKARNVSDPEIFHHTTLIAFLAWVGLGADGLSSSAYGPEEAYKALGAEDQLQVDRFEGGHEWSGRVAYPLLEKALA